MWGMRVLVVTPWFPSLKAPGAGLFNLRDVELLARDHEVTVLHLVDPRYVDPDEPRDARVTSNIRVQRLPFLTAKPQQLRDAVAAIRAESDSADLVHTMAFHSLLPTTLARTNLPWVHTEHWSGLVTAPPSLRARIGGKFLRRNLAKPDVLVAVGKPLAEAISKFRCDPAVLIGNRVGLAAPGALPAPPSLKTDSTLRLFGVGGLGAHKGPLEAVEVTAELRSRGVNAMLEWAGTGALETDVRKLAGELGIDDHVRLLGHVDPEELSEALLQSNMFILPTASETFGVAIAEALGHGLPVVTTGVGGHLDFLPPAGSRWVNERTAAALADAIIDLANDQHRMQPVAIAEYAKRRFSEDARRTEYRKVYERATSAHRAT